LAILPEVPETTQEEGDGEIPRSVSDRIIADVRSLIAAKARGFENRTKAGKTLGVSQPSVSAWLRGKARVSYKIARVAEQKIGKDYLGEPQDTPETREWGMKWKALSLLVRDGFDVRRSFVAVEQQKHDRTHVNVSWGDYYESAKAGLAGEQSAEADIPLPPGPPPPPRLQPKLGSGVARRTMPPLVEAAAKRELTKPSKKSPHVQSRKTGK
jgi:hypothetical protein